MLKMKSMALQGPGIVNEGLALDVSDKQSGRALPLFELHLLWPTFGKGCLQGCICH